MKQQEIETLLGRPLSSGEVTNLKTYLEIAKQELESLLCLSLDCGISETRTYEPREGMSTVFTDIFSEATAVTVDGTAVTEYHKAFWDNRNGKFFNSIVFDTVPTGEVVIDADWGFDKLPYDLKSLWAQMFAIVSKKKTSSRVKSKKVEDFSVTFSDETSVESFARDNSLTISKYSMCNIGNLRSGEVC